MNEEAARDANKQVISDTKRARAFEEMMRTEGWKLYVELLNSKLSDLMKNLFDPPRESVRLDDYNKGACNGLLTARDLPSATVAAHKASMTSSETAHEERD